MCIYLPIIRTGTQVLISRLDPLKEAKITGSVLSRSPTQLRICFPSPFFLDEGTWRLDLGRPNLIYNRMRTAITQLATNPVDIMKLVPSPSSEYILEGTELRDIILRSFIEPEAQLKRETEEMAASLADIPTVKSITPPTPPLSFDGAFKEDQRIHSWVRRYLQPNPIVMEGDPSLEGLNSSQIRAMAMMIGERFSLIQGVGIALS